MMKVSLLLVLFLSLVAISLAGESKAVHANPHHVVLSGPHPPPVERNHENEKRTGSLSPLTPTVLKSSYGVSTTSTTLGSGKTIAIVDAYGASTAISDLTYAASYWGLPAPSITKVNQTGGTTFPANDPATTGNWGLEVGLDIQAVHAMADGAHILLVVCNSNSGADLFAGISYARAHANYVSMSFGFAEGSYISYYDSYFSGTSTVSFFASTGDNGSAGGIEYPSSSQYVIGVGGTSLYTSGGTYAAETGWSGSGGGCSAYSTALSVQKTTAGYACGNYKSVPDMSMVGDPNSGLYVYITQKVSTTTCTPPNCWYIVGGTSLASPLAASRAAIRETYIAPSYIYTGTIAFRDITSGSNGAHSCAAGLDEVTGRGSWIGAS